MGYHDIMQVCLNGHLITGSYNKSPEHRKDYCPKCGKKTITTCPNCNEDIKGSYYYYNDLIREFRRSNRPTIVPEKCEHCGCGFPWNNISEIQYTALVTEDFDVEKDTPKLEKIMKNINNQIFVKKYIYEQKKLVDEYQSLNFKAEKIKFINPIVSDLEKIIVDWENIDFKEICQKKDIPSNKAIINEALTFWKNELEKLESCENEQNDNENAIISQTIVNNYGGSNNVSVGNNNQNKLEISEGKTSRKVLFWTIAAVVVAIIGIIISNWNKFF